MPQPSRDLPPAPPIEDPRETFRRFLASRGLRVTNQRMAIFDAAIGHGQPFTAEDLLARSREIDESVSRATVYRALPIFKESGILREIDVGHDNKYYAANEQGQNFQAQVVCADCDRIVEVDAPFMHWYGETVCKKLGMRLIAPRLQVTAHCLSLEEHGFCPQASR
ncbi:MAG: Fur family transcriptional regulator [Opitutales bacterium]